MQNLCVNLSGFHRDKSANSEKCLCFYFLSNAWGFLPETTRIRRMERFEHISFYSCTILPKINAEVSAVGPDLLLAHWLYFFFPILRSRRGFWEFWWALWPRDSHRWLVCGVFVWGSGTCERFNEKQRCRSVHVFLLLLTVMAPGVLHEYFFVKICFFKTSYWAST